MKVSLITAVLNAEDCIASCINSIIQQDYADIEYIVIDGASSDRTVSIIETYRSQIDLFVSEADTGYYCALNRGISMASGDVIGLLNADDVLSGPRVISTIVNYFRNHTCDGVYGNLVYTAAHDGSEVVRNWRSGTFQRRSIQFGWMPPHPTLYLRREVYQKFGGFSTSFGYSCDYEFVLRIFYKHQISAVHIDELLVKMRTGGMSNKNFRQLLSGIVNDYRSLQSNGISSPLLGVVSKKLRKIKQYL